MTELLTNGELHIVPAADRGHWRIRRRSSVYVHLHADAEQLEAALDEIRAINPAFTVFGPLACDLHGGCRRGHVVVLPQLHLVELIRLKDRLATIPAFAGSRRALH